MYTIGLTSWSEHKSLIKNINHPLTLQEYSAFFPTVELDTFFYGIPRVTSVASWLTQVPSNFKFVIKANHSFTLHPREELTTEEISEKISEFKKAISPLVDNNALKTILCQFPPYFDATTKNVTYLRYLIKELANLPLSFEFRNRSWFNVHTFNSLINFCTQNDVTLVAVDEPDVGQLSIPFKSVITNKKLLLVRLHGRNKAGWQHKGPDWRKYRTFYDYTDSELSHLKDTLLLQQNSVQEICIIFNNNSGGHAAKNALSLKSMMNIKFDNLNKKPPEQLDFF
ncbi:DUF72 domain-containing protein [Liquorilactobacillus mali]|uniref:DUF72 domain-containing protein n=1 Tax=Liquorilactobacillus mali KCTC 3596 = DSM 20444 TaxID=1046596 RepID=J0L2W2_9LACO|nr:DUF72 domain-containing protein [Liquorilactobacillus mali]EJE97265.1 hypothetical protein LMA_10397 [Liquorilactobacillus mali KCTC 3596 = DSM 20444]KRN11348.1 hypothetical protein FD00_GL000753 [Liquorilactobacillus mali KCTC 3596 = DSM 20444]MDC7953147.1 DUF72 domain-containing protein [Liquorilactobacillus mali]MDV7757260.1 DUF72 domain-containing protein [Liquorilactobacillus mali]QFQ75318.1 DUF72 domain-containing protein [Liquorilactobacillus mali]